MVVCFLGWIFVLFSVRLMLGLWVLLADSGSMLRLIMGSLYSFFLFRLRLSYLVFGDVAICGVVILLVSVM